VVFLKRFSKPSLFPFNKFLSEQTHIHIKSPLYTTHISPLKLQVLISHNLKMHGYTHQELLGCALLCQELPDLQIMISLHQINTHPQITLKSQQTESHFTLFHFSRRISHHEILQTTQNSCPKTAQT